MAIKVDDLERSLAFCRDRLGYTETMRFHHDGGSVMPVCPRITTDVHLALFPGAETARAPGPTANGLHHFSLTVDDLDAATAEITAAAVPQAPAIKLGLDGNRQARIEDPDSNRIERMDMSPTGFQAQAIAWLPADS